MKNNISGSVDDLIAVRNGIAIYNPFVSACGTRAVLPVEHGFERRPGDSWLFRVAQDDTINIISDGKMTPLTAENAFLYRRKGGDVVASGSLAAIIEAVASRCA